MPWMGDDFRLGRGWAVTMPLAARRHQRKVRNPRQDPMNREDGGPARGIGEHRWFPFSLPVRTETREDPMNLSALLSANELL